MNPAALLSAAHRYLSGIENLGAIRMRDICKELEALGRSDTTEGAGPLLLELQKQFDVTRAQLLTMFPEMRQAEE
jgi:HPt (histidine-containing phosphotransfer) domain-containing protein